MHRQHIIQHILQPIWKADRPQVNPAPSYEPVLPENWVWDFFDLADLDASFAALSDCTHFHAETMRGRIRSFQLRLEEAQEHFARAWDIWRTASPSIPNAVRKFVLEVYELENRLLQGPISEPVESPAPKISDSPERVAEKYPEIQYVENVRLSIEALLDLHLGRFETGARSYRTMVERYGVETGGAARERAPGACGMSLQPGRAG